MNPRSQHLCPSRHVACGIVVPQLSKSANHWKARGFPVAVSPPLPHGCPTCQALAPPAPLASPTTASSKKPRPCSAATSGRRQAPSDAAGSKRWLCWPGGPQTVTTPRPPDSRDSARLPRAVCSAPRQTWCRCAIVPAAAAAAVRARPHSPCLLPSSLLPCARVCPGPQPSSAMFPEAKSHQGRLQMTTAAHPSPWRQTGGKASPP